jgi:hypothetical protein
LKLNCEALKMKLSWLLILISLTKCSESFKLSYEQHNYSNLCEAFHQTSKVLKFNGASTINFIAANSLNSFKAKEFFSHVSKSAMFAYRRETAGGIKEVLKRKRTYTALSVESFSDFEEIYKSIDEKLFRFSGFYLIVLVDGDISEVQKMFEHLWQLQIYNANVMFEDENGEVLVKTFMPFSPGKCGDTTPVLINKFKDGKFQNSDELFPKKLKNLHNCPIRVAVTNDNPPCVIETFSAEGTQQLSGRDIDVLRSLSESLNFKVDYSYVGPVGYFFENGTSVGPFKTILDNNTDMSISNWWLKQSRVGTFGFSNSYASDKLVFIIPPGKKFTALEKLIYPFKLTSWTLIVMVFVVGILVILIVQFQSKTVRDFVFGTGVKTPLLNLFVAFIGGNQKKLPRRNFARFLLMMFLIYSLIIRTVYQGSYFELMKSNRGHKKVQSIKEMIDKNFKFYTFKGNEDIYHPTLEIAKRLISGSVSKIKKIQERISQDPDFLGVHDSTLLNAVYWNDQHDAYNQKNICKESLMTIPEVIYTKKNFFLLDEINDKLNHLVSAGLIEFWSFHRSKTLNENSIPKALSFGQLQGGFGILAVGVIISLVAFVCERYLSDRFVLCNLSIH